jgi:hypothetical protein
MDETKRPLIGYLLVSTEYIPGGDYEGSNGCDEKYNDADDPYKSYNIIACKIHDVLEEFRENGEIQGPYGGNIVESNEPHLTMIIYFSTKKPEMVSTIAGRIQGFSAQANSEVKVTDVKTAIKLARADGFEGPP